MASIDLYDYLADYGYEPWGLLQQIKHDELRLLALEDIGRTGPDVFISRVSH